MDNELTNNKIKVYTTSAPGGLTVSTSNIQQTLGVTNNKAREYADLAKKYRDETKDLRDDAKYYAEQNADVTMSYVNELEARLQRGIDSKQTSGDYALNSSIPTNVSSLNNDSQYVNTTQLGTAIDSVRLPSQTGHDGKFLYTNGEISSWEGVNSLSIFDVIKKDHILSYAESKGYVQIGEYVYKEAVAGSHYGYPDFYSKCLEEYNTLNNTLEIIKNNYTVVGSPTITSDGIASGFSTSDYLTHTLNLTGATSLKIEFNNIYCPNQATSRHKSFFELQPSSNSSYFGLRLYKNSLLNGVLGGIYPSSDGSATSINLDPGFGTTENFSGYVEIKNNKLSFVVNNTNCGNYTLTSEQLAYIFTNVTLSIGATTHSGSGQILNSGSIDLKQFSITVDGVPVLTGNQTGIDTIKSDDYTVVGSPTISAEGIYTSTDTNTNNYVYFSNFTANNNLKLELEFSLIGGAYEGYFITTSTFISTTDAMYIGAWGLNWALFGANGVGGRNYFQSGHSYKLYLEWKVDGTTELGVKKDSSDTWSTSNGTWSGTLPSAFPIGYRYDNKGVAVIDLNKVKIYVDGDLVYQPCLKIPYTLSNTNKKIVDTAYRSRVQDMYEQFGYTPYYMSDEYHEVMTYRVVDCISTNSNGHRYYNISNKPEIDAIYNNTGEAWFYGIDTVNERILLPRTSDIDSGKYLYMVVGNTPSWAGLTDLVNQGTTILNQINTGISNAIETRLDLGITNISAAGKDNVIRLLIPDYTAGISLTMTSSTPYTAPSHGFFWLRVDNTNTGAAVVMVNGYSVGENWNFNYDASGSTLCAFVEEGDVISVADYAANTPKGVFYPLKGVN